MQQPKVFWWFVGTAGGILLLFVVLWGLIGWRYASGKPTPTVDYVAKMKALSKAPGGEPAWPLLQKALNAWGDELEEPLVSWVERPFGPLEDWEAADVSEAEACLSDSENVDRLQALVRIPLERPRLGFPSASEVSSLDEWVTIGHYGVCQAE